MRRWIRIAAALYPRNWREQYGPEFAALLDDVKPGWRVFANVIGGAIRMQLTTGNWLKLAGAMAMAGAAVALGVSFTATPQFVASATVGIVPQPDPVRPVASPQALAERAAADFVHMKANVLSRQSLATIITGLGLYREERKKVPIQDVEDQMRRDIRIEARPSTDHGQDSTIFSVSFSYPDRAKAEKAVRALVAEFSRQNESENWDRAFTYQHLWRDLSAAQHLKAVPPPPLGDKVEVLDQSPPKESAGPNRTLFLIYGLGAGLLLGLLVSGMLRWPRPVLRLGGFAVAGFLLAFAATFLIPARYTSTAVMAVAPAAVLEDPLAAPRAATPAAEILRQLEPDVLSFATLSGVVGRANLYPEELARRPAEEVVRNMLARDLRIAVVNPDAFSIFFSYPDRRKAQDGVNALMAAFEQESIRRAKEELRTRNSATLREIFARHAGEYLDVVDPASTPYRPEWPNRPMFAAAGLGAGLLAGAIMLYRRGRGAPVPQPA